MNTPAPTCTVDNGDLYIKIRDPKDNFKVTN